MFALQDPCVDDVASAVCCFPKTMRVHMYMHMLDLGIDHPSAESKAL